MSQIKSWLKRHLSKNQPAPAETEAANPDIALASQVGNQAMASSLGDNADTSAERMDDIKSQLDARIQPTPDDPLGLGEGEDREAWLDNLPGARALYEKNDSQESVQNAKDPAETMKNYHHALATSTKAGGGQDSRSFYDVKQAMHTVLLALSSSSSLSGDIGADTKTLYGVIKAYNALIESSQAYIQSHKALSIAGKKRKNIVRRIEKQAVKDLQGFRDYADIHASLPEDQRATSVKDILGQSRRRVIELKNGKESDLKHVGGAASYIAVVNQSDTKDGGASGFFKETEEYKIQDEKITTVEAIDTAVKRSGFPEAPAFAKALKQSLFKESTKNADLDVYISSAAKLCIQKKLIDDADMWAFQSFLNFVKAAGDTGAHDANARQLAGISSKNVLAKTTSMLANQGDIAAEVKEIEKIVREKLKTARNPFEVINKSIKTSSRYQSDEKFRKATDTYEEELKAQRRDWGLLNETAWEIHEGESVKLSNRNVATSRIANLLGIGDVVAQSETAELKDADGTSRTGNLMQKAKGIEASSFFAGLHENEYDYQKQIRPQSKPILSSNQDKVTPQYMKSLTSLQVLDNLVGQVDRHSDNYFVEEAEGGKAGHVQGIDNDYSFNNVSLYGNDRGVIGNHGISIAQGGKLTLPYMDAALADNILNLEEDEARLALHDLLEPWAIDSFCIRLAQAKKVIGEAKEIEPHRFLTEDRHWNSRVYNEFSQKGENGQHTSYIGRQEDHAQAKTTGYINRIKTNRQQKQQDQADMEKATEIWSRVSSPEEAEQLLRAKGVTNELILYIKKRNMLTGDPAVLSQFPIKELAAKIAKA